jgi:signal transduction histidine kinase
MLPDGQYGVICYYYDSSKLRQAETALLDSEQQFRVLIQNLQSAVALINERGEFTIVNKAFLRIFELDEFSNIKNVNDCDWSQWQVFDEYGSLLDIDEHPIRKAALTCRPVWDKLVAVKAPTYSKLKWLLVSAEPILGAQGQIHRLICTYHDITARKQAEEALKKLNEDLENMVMQRTNELREKDQMLIMQSRQAAMGEMIGNIAHQWRQPLNILGMQLQQLTLFHEMGQFNKELLNNNVAKSMELIMYMSRTIDDFRNYFKPDQDKADFKIHDSINRTLSLFEGGLKNPLIEVEVIIKDDLVINGYQNEFAQVILNILTNARDIIIERAIDKPKVTISIYYEGGYAVITVADNAGGIPEDIINKIFEPYFTTKGPHQGTGVGLFMSKSIIEKNMGGHLDVRNIDDGAEFRVEVGYGNSN